ncbi:hypothetical protein BGZ97_000656, partial [Linnemannia gamsii]
MSSNSRPTTAMHSKAMTATTISGTGTIRGPLDLSRLELEVNNDFYIHNDDDPTSKRSSLKGPDHGRTGDIHITSTSTSRSPDQERGRPQQQQRDDLLNPPRFVIRQPSLSAISKASRATSPSPSLTSS